MDASAAAQLAAKSRDLEDENSMRRFAEGKLWAENAEVALALAGDPLGLREAGRLSLDAPVGDHVAGLHREVAGLTLSCIQTR